MTELLIVDDNEQNLYMLQTLLQGHGYEVVSATNGAEALDMARRDPPDMIISDILMPVMDGFALCREWKKDEQLKRIPFVFYTATYTDPKDEKFALGLGAERFLVKPIEPEVLVEIFKEVIEEHQAGQLVASRKPMAEETVYYKEYNEALIRKLEDKMVQLEEANRALEHDIAERKRAEEALRKSEARLAEAQRIAHLGDWDWNMQTGEVHWSEETYRIFGLTPQDFDLTYETFLEAVHPYDREFVKKSIDEALAGQKSYSLDHRILSPNGEERIVHEQAEVTFDQTGQPIRMVGTTQDITERRHLEEQYRQAQKMEAIGRLAGGVAHDFNNLLTAIMGYAGLALQALSPADPLRSDLGAIQEAAERATNLTRQLLAFARKQVIHPTVLNPNELILNVDKMLRRLIGEDIELATLPAPNLGQVKADPGQLEQVLLNLAVNARDAMPNGGKLIIETANVFLDENYVDQHLDVPAGEYVMLAVSDTGVGMTEEVKAHLFEPFFTTKEKGKGTGLGLATCFGIVKQSGGHIEAYSEVDRGTTFKIYLPCLEEAISPRPGRATFDDLPEGTETVLLVEDETSVRELAIRALRQQGYKMLEAADGDEALRVAQELAGQELHLLLTDVVLPRLGGGELADRLKAMWPNLKVLFTSGYTDKAIVYYDVLEPGMAFLPKPFSSATLVRKVREVLDG